MLSFSLFPKSSNAANEFKSKPKSSQSEPSFVQSFLKSSGYVFKRATQLIVLSRLIPSANAVVMDSGGGGDLCFMQDQRYGLYSEKNWDYYHQLESVGAYGGYDDDCDAPRDYKHLTGRSFFGIPVCTLWFKYPPGNSALIAKLDEICPTGYGASYLDYVITAGLGLAGICFIRCGYVCVNHSKTTQEPSQEQPGANGEESQDAKKIEVRTDSSELLTQPLLTGQSSLLSCSSTTFAQQVVPALEPESAEQSQQPVMPGAKLSFTTA